MADRGGRERCPEVPPCDFCRALDAGSNPFGKREHAMTVDEYGGQSRALAFLIVDELDRAKSAVPKGARFTRQLRVECVENTLRDADKRTQIIHRVDGGPHELP